MRKNIIVLFTIILVSSCVSTNEKEAIKVIKEILKTDEVELGSGSFKNTSNNEVQFKSITIKSSKFLNDKSKLDQCISSIVAINFYMYIKDDLNGLNAINVVLEREIDGNIIRVEKLYYIDTLNMVFNNTWEKCQTIGKGFVNKNYELIYNQLHPKLKGNYTFPEFKNYLTQADDSAGFVKSGSIVGFEIINYEKQVGRKFLTVHYWLELERNKSLNHEMELEYTLPPDSINLIKFHF